MCAMEWRLSYSTNNAKLAEVYSHLTKSSHLTVTAKIKSGAQLRMQPINKATEARLEKNQKSTGYHAQESDKSVKSVTRGMDVQRNV